MLIEIIATSVLDAIAAQEAGADRIELVTGMSEGGLTPSYALIENVYEAISIPVNVMIRPHSRSFHYDEYDLEVMLKDIAICKKIGVNGVVFGTLTENKEIDERVLQRLILASDGLDITFHRAFDEVNNFCEALNILMKYKEISRILTSGGHTSVTDGIFEIQSFIDQSKPSHIKIMPGSGLTLENVISFIKPIEVEELHFGSAVRYDYSFSHQINRENIRTLKRLLNKE